MAISKLATDFVDAVTAQQEYKVTDVGNGEALFEDVSTYTTDGSYFGANEINTQHQTINDVITVAENTDLALTKLKNGTTVVSSATLADRVDSATSATSATKAGSLTSDIVINEQTLTFTNKVCTISNANVTAKSLVDVIFSRDTLDTARRAVITVESSTGTITLTAGRTPSGTIKARFHIRVVE